jgi:expansin (peptidoglycan-binding protein)
MHSAPRGPARGNRIWLTGGVISAVGLGTALVLYPTAPGCPNPAGTTQAMTGQLTAARMGNTPRAGPASGSAPTRVRATAVFYNPGDVVGSCNLGPLRAKAAYASLPPRRFAHGAACGTYLEVAGPHGRVRAEVVDLCEACEPTTINLSRAAFRRVASLVPGSATVTFWRVTNPSLPGPLEVRVSLTSSGHRALQVINHGNRLASVAVAPHAGAGPWQSMTQGTHDFWVATQDLGAGPFTVAVTDTLGHRALLTSVRLTPGTLVRSSVWMYHGAPRAARTRHTHHTHSAASGGCRS